MKKTIGIALLVLICVSSGCQTLRTSRMSETLANSETTVYLVTSYASRDEWPIEFFSANKQRGYTCPLHNDERLNAVYRKDKLVGYKFTGEKDAYPTRKWGILKDNRVYIALSVIKKYKIIGVRGLNIYPTGFEPYNKKQWEKLCKRAKWFSAYKPNHELYEPKCTRKNSGFSHPKTKKHTHECTQYMISSSFKWKEGKQVFVYKGYKNPLVHVHEKEIVISPTLVKKDNHKYLFYWQAFRTRLLPN